MISFISITIQARNLNQSLFNVGENAQMAHGVPCGKIANYVIFIYFILPHVASCSKNLDNLL